MTHSLTGSLPSIEEEATDTEELLFAPSRDRLSFALESIRRVSEISGRNSPNLSIIQEEEDCLSVCFYHSMTIAAPVASMSASLSPRSPRARATTAAPNLLFVGPGIGLSVSHLLFSPIS
jgi:hypothetical protein